MREFVLKMIITFVTQAIIWHSWGPDGGTSHSINFGPN